MLDKLVQINENLWEIPKSTFKHMRKPARVYLSRELLELAASDRSLRQLSNVSSLPGIQGYSLAMPDMHEGYGFPIGGVAALDAKDGVISPGGIGYDINCGVRLLKSQLFYDDIKNRKKTIAEEIYKAVPSGVGKGGGFQLNHKELDNVLNTGCQWALDNGFASDDDLKHTESNGRLPHADAKAVSSHAKNRGMGQLGTMGAGNHFVEIGKIQHIFDEEAAAVFGLSKEQIIIQIHTGSRGLGHQVAGDFIKQMIRVSKSFGYNLPDRELACAPINSPLGDNYFAAMCAAANYAWTNRQLITTEVREAWRELFGSADSELSLLYDVAHNIAKLETHRINDEVKKVIVHRKGATRAFPPGHTETPNDYRNVGQPVLIPGSMGTASYVLAGQPGSMEQTFGSACHGAGRTMSRSKAKKQIDARELLKSLDSKGIAIQAGSLKGASEEAPDAYKDVEKVVDVVHNAGLAKKVARIVPVAVIKG